MQYLINSALSVSFLFLHKCSTSFQTSFCFLSFPSQMQHIISDVCFLSFPSQMQHIISDVFLFPFFSFTNAAPHFRRLSVSFTNAAPHFSPRFTKCLHMQSSESENLRNIIMSIISNVVLFNMQVTIIRFHKPVTLKLILILIHIWQSCF